MWPHSQRYSPRRDVSVAVAIADRLSALLAGNIAREARRAGLSERTIKPTIIRPPHSDLPPAPVKVEGVHRVPSRVGDRALARSFLTSLPGGAPPERHVKE